MAARNKKSDLHLDDWAKTLAPSTELRRWFAHDRSKWLEFCKRYRAELTAARATQTIRGLLDAGRGAKAITLLYGARDCEHNEVIVLRNLFERPAKKGYESIDRCFERMG